MQLAAAIEAALGHGLGAGDRLALAVSGGPDSIALLVLAAAQLPGRFTVLTVDHGLRGGSDAEAAAVADACAAQGIAHHILPWQGDKPAANLQAAARTARYALMAEWCARNGHRLLLTAHHADDQAETLLMRLGRGSGSGGLAGIRQQRELVPGVTLVRPLLGVRRAALAAIAAASGWPVADDPSNRNPRFARTAARALLAATPWLDAARMADAAAHLADAEAALAWAADRAWAGNVVVAAGALRIDATGLPMELQRRLVDRAIKTFATQTVLRGGDVARLAARLAAGGTGTLAGVRASGGPVWMFTRAAPRTSHRNGR